MRNDRRSFNLQLKKIKIKASTGIETTTSATQGQVL